MVLELPKLITDVNTCLTTKTIYILYSFKKNWNKLILFFTYKTGLPKLLLSVIHVKKKLFMIWWLIYENLPPSRPVEEPLTPPIGTTIDSFAVFGFQISNANPKIKLVKFYHNLFWPPTVKSSLPVLPKQLFNLMISFRNRKNLKQ